MNECAIMMTVVDEEHGHGLGWVCRNLRRCSNEWILKYLSWFWGLNTELGKQALGALLLWEALLLIVRRKEGTTVAACM
jgi:hypothetical protein